MSALAELRARGYAVEIRRGRLYLDPPGAPPAIRALAHAARGQILSELLAVPDGDQLKAWSPGQLRERAWQLFRYLYWNPEEDNSRFMADFDRVQAELSRRGLGIDDAEETP